MRIIPSPVADKLGKTIPRLASTHDAEVLATVAAIRRTLDGAGLALHDLAGCVNLYAGPRVSVVSSTPQPQTRPSQPAPSSKAAKPKREASPWPTYSTLSRLARSELLRTFATTGTFALMTDADRDAFHELRAKIDQRPHEFLSRKEARLFNQYSAALSTLRPHERKAA